MFKKIKKCWKRQIKLRIKKWIDSRLLVCEICDKNVDKKPFSGGINLKKDLTLSKDTKKVTIKKLREYAEGLPDDLPFNGDPEYRPVAKEWVFWFLDRYEKEKLGG